MRLRRTANLRVTIPTFPDDYVEMPPEVRRLTASLSPPSAEQANEHGKPEFQSDAGKDDTATVHGNDNSNPENYPDVGKANIEIEIEPLPNYEDEPQTVLDSNDQKEHNENSQTNQDYPYKANLQNGRPLPNYDVQPHSVIDSPMRLQNQTKENHQDPNTQNYSLKVDMQVGRTLPNYEDTPVLAQKDQTQDYGQDAQSNVSMGNIQIGRPLPNYDMPHTAISDTPKTDIKDSHQDYYPKTNSRDDCAKANFQIGRPLPNYEDRPDTPEVTILESFEDLKDENKRDSENRVNFGEVVYRKISRSSMSVPYGLQYGEGSMRRDQSNVSVPFSYLTTGGLVVGIPPSDTKAVGSNLITPY